MIDTEVIELLEPHLAGIEGDKQYFNITPELALKLAVIFKNHVDANDKFWKGVDYLSNKINNEQYIDTPKHPISLDTNKMEITQGVKRLIALVNSDKPYTFWLEIIV